MKERRTRKPILSEAKPIRNVIQSIIGGRKPKTDKVELEDINKKLDEILSE